MEPSPASEPSRDSSELSPADLIRLHEHLLELGATLGLQTLHAKILQAWVVLMSADKGNLQILNHATGTLSISAQVGFEPEFLLTFAAINAADEDQSLCTRAVVRRQGIFSSDVTRETDFVPVREAATAAGFRSVQSTPLFSSAGDLLAVVSTHWNEPHRPTERQLAAMDLFLRQAAQFLERRASDDVRNGALAHERSAWKAAEDLNRGKDRFIATIAHELRQPLAPMIAALALMKLRVSREKGERARQIVERQLAQLVRLVEDLVDAARVNKGKAHLRSDRLDLRNVVKDAIDAVDDSARAKRQTIALVAPDAEAWVNVDAGRIQQVFGNLLSNASKFSDEDSAISITISVEGADVRVDVPDQGRGIAEDALPYVFDMFRQSAEGESGGLGIGLSVVRALVELHGGTVEAQSAGSGLGSTFAVRLPKAV